MFVKFALVEMVPYWLIEHRFHTGGVSYLQSERPSLMPRPLIQSHLGLLIPDCDICQLFHINVRILQVG